MSSLAVLDVQINDLALFESGHNGRSRHPGEGVAEKRAASVGEGVDIYHIYTTSPENHLSTEISNISQRAPTADTERQSPERKTAKFDGGNI